MSTRRHVYRMTSMGDYKYYLISPSGRIKNDERDDDYNNWKRDTWKVKGIAPDYRYRYPTKRWKEMKQALDRGEIIKGVLFDIDHGTERMWGNGRTVKIQKIEL